MGRKSYAQPGPRKDLIAEKLVTIDYIDGNRLLPKVRADKSVLEALAAPWKEALIIKLLGKTIGYQLMRNN